MGKTTQICTVSLPQQFWIIQADMSTYGYTLWVEIVEVHAVPMNFHEKFTYSSVGGVRDSWKGQNVSNVQYQPCVQYIIVGTIPMKTWWKMYANWARNLYCRLSYNLLVFDQVVGCMNTFRWFWKVMLIFVPSATVFSKSNLKCKKIQLTLNFSLESNL